MDAIFHSTSFAVAMAASTLLSAIWEGAVLAACVFVCLRMFPGLSAAARSVVWTNVFVLLVLLHFVPFVGVFDRGATAGRSAPFELDLKWGLAIAGAWASLSIFRAAQLILSAVRLRGLVRRAMPIPVDEALRGLLRIKSAGMRGDRSAELFTSDEVERPSVLGFLHPRILLPPRLRERLTAAELQQVVRHEMEHLRRGDDWTNLLQKIALVIFPLNPVLLWVEHRLCAERELACDDSVLRSSCGRRAYAICLTRLAEHSMLRRGLSLALGAWERQPELVRRVHRILRRPAEAMSRRQTLALTGSVIVGVMACAVGLARSPQLVGFAEPHAQAMAQLPPSTDIRAAAVAKTQLPASVQPAHAEMIKAVMPWEEMPGRPLAAATNKIADQAKPVARNAALRSHRRHNVEQQQAWVVMTNWSDADGFPQLVLAVEQTNGSSSRSGKSGSAQVKRASYAAVPFADGWLLVEI
jgi:beta-lactamase regulating signal transducer with metallopeptidase domain